MLFRSKFSAGHLLVHAHVRQAFHGILHTTIYQESGTDSGQYPDDLLCSACTGRSAGLPQVGVEADKQEIKALQIWIYRSDKSVKHIPKEQMYKMLRNSLRNGRSKRTGLPIELVRHQERRNLHVPTFFRGGVHAATCLLLDSSLTATLVAPANCFCNILYICSFSMSWQIFTHKSS